MANYHTNLLVIAASERDMVKVLKLNVRNFLACAGKTRFALQGLEQYESAPALFGQLEGYFDGFYEVAFSGAASQDLREGADIQPSGESAQTKLNRYGGAFVLSLQYDGTSESNAADVDDFFSLLETGSYGVARFAAGEVSGYESVSVFNGMHPGGEPLELEKYARICGDVDAGVLEADARRLIEVPRESINDLAELAYAVAVCRWPEYESAQYDVCFRVFHDYQGSDNADDFDEWYQERFPQEIDYEEEYERRWSESSESWSAAEKSFFSMLPSFPIESGRIDWITPAAADLKLVGECLAEMVMRLPIHAMLDCDNYEVNQRAIASALAGDEVRITSSWSCSNFDEPVGLAVESLDGVEFGHLGGGELWSKTDSRAPMKNMLCALACLLPYLTARIDKVMPIALRSGCAQCSIFIVRIELGGGLHERIEEGVRALLSQPCADRGRSSSVKRR